MYYGNCRMFWIWNKNLISDILQAKEKFGADAKNLKSVGPDMELVKGILERSSLQWHRLPSM
jgi:hypothetical protein